MSKTRKALSGLMVCLFALAGCAPEETALGGSQQAAAGSGDAEWKLYGNDAGEQRFSPLTQIDKSNVSDLGLAWSFELGSSRGVESTPIVVDGVMYVTAPWSIVFALNAKTGEQIWRYDPRVPRQWGRFACCDVVNRGVAVSNDTVFVGTIDGRLVAIDAENGTLEWQVQTTPTDKPYTITGAPRVIKDKVIIGNGGAELGVRGFITAYDAATGEQAWRFYTVPGNPADPVEHPALESAMATWNGNWWEIGGGGTAWDSMAYDPELNLMYLGVGNGSPWTRYARSPGGGDNLYLSSIIAIDPDTGRMAWYYQTTPGDNWDYTAVQHIMLADLEIEGVKRKVLLQAPKNGFFYVLDRTNGDFISATPYVTMNWATHVDPETGRPVETAEADYQQDPKLVLPGPWGGHNWHPMSFNPSTGLVYLPAHDTSLIYSNDTEFEHQPWSWNLGMDIGAALEQLDELPEFKGYLIAWDPIQQKAVWRKQHKGFWNGGTLATGGGLVFQGTGDGLFAAYDAETGDVLWQTDSTTGIMAPPVTYTVDGDQYVAVAAGYGGGVIGGANPDAIINDYHNEGRVLVFRLGGNADMPLSASRDKTVPKPPEMEASEEELAHGQSLYGRHCSTCHGGAVVGSWVVPDLRYMQAGKHSIFNEIVVNGAMQSLGMPEFSDYVEADDARAIHAYVISQARVLYEEQQAGTSGD